MNRNQPEAAVQPASPSSVDSRSTADLSTYRRRRRIERLIPQREVVERGLSRNSVHNDDEKKEDDLLRLNAEEPPKHMEKDSPSETSEYVCFTPKSDASFVRSSRIASKRSPRFPFPHSTPEDEKKTRSAGNDTVTTATASSAAEESAKEGGYMPLHEKDSYRTDKVSTGEGSEDRQEGSFPCTQPQHWAGTLEEDGLRYYRVVYRGVVALLSAADTSAPRSGHYLSYGEIFASRYEEEVGSDSGPILSPQVANENTEGSPAKSVQNVGSISSVETLKTSSALPSSMPAIETDSLKTKNTAIRVDKVLTGGYATDARDGPTIGPESETPKRSNTFYVPVVESPPFDGSQSQDGPTLSPSNSSFGFLFARRKDLLIAEPISTTPQAEEGKFLYKIVSSSPLPILAGPSFDAPRTKAMVLPGTVHEASLRISIDPNGERVCFLRLCHRRGWIADRKVSTRNGAVQTVPVVQELRTDSGASNDDGSVSVLSSVATSSVTTPIVATRRRHRPPRRQSDTSKERVDKALPRQIGGKPPVAASTLAKTTRNGVNDTALTPSSNVSILSDDSSLEQNTSHKHHIHPASPDISYSTQKSSGSTTTSPSMFFLMRVTAPRGLKILDAPQFQVNNLIHRKQSSTNVSSSHMVSQIESAVGPPKTHQSIFQTMSGRLTSTGPSQTGTPAVFDSSSKTRILPRGALFEASKRMESTGAYSQGAGLIKLSDNSGWAIVPRRDELDHQYRYYQGGVAGVKEGEALRSYEEVGNAIIESNSIDSTERTLTSYWLRIGARPGIAVSCPPPLSPENDDDTSPTSSRGSSAVSGSNHGSNFGLLTSHDSDVASSVGSAFLDAMFRTPKKKEQDVPQDPPPRPSKFETHVMSTTIPCGMCVEVEKWVDLSMDQNAVEYARLKGGQGWLPLSFNGKPCSTQVSRPDFRFGSFWFRVQSNRGIKVRLGPSRKAPSIKSDDGVYFRFECGEFLRASEIMTVFSNEGEPVECFAKLYRNRHVRLHSGHEEYRQLQSLTAPAEWVQIYNDKELFLEECAEEPRIERHQQGWRYNVIPDLGVAVRKGPSFASTKTGIVLLGGESVLINERVSPAGDKITWLRIKDGQGWLHDVDDQGEQVLLAHSLRHRTKTTVRPVKTPGKHEEIAYNTIIARLFHNDAPGEGYKPQKDLKGLK